MDTGFKDRIIKYLKNRLINIKCSTLSTVNEMIKKIENINNDIDLMTKLILEYPKMILWCYLKMKNTKLFLTDNDVRDITDLVISLNNKSTKELRVLFGKAKSYKKYQGV